MKETSESREELCSEEHVKAEAQAQPRSELLGSVFMRVSEAGWQNRGRVASGSTKSTSKVEEKSKGLQVLALGDG